MVLFLRTAVVVAALGLFSSKAQAQTQLSTQPPATGSATPAAAAPATTLPTLLRPAEVQGKSYKTYLIQRYAADKEARAAIHLFSRKQTGGGIWLGSGAVVIGGLASQTGTTTSSSGTSTFTITPLGYGILVGVFGGVGVGKLIRFSNSKLYEALREYDQRGALPGYVVSKLKGRDYR